MGDESVFESVLKGLHLAMQSEDCDVDECGTALLWAEQRIAAQAAEIAELKEENDLLTRQHHWECEMAAKRLAQEPQHE
jgi:hypothetical protein